MAKRTACDYVDPCSGRTGAARFKKLLVPRESSRDKFAGKVIRRLLTELMWRMEFCKLQPRTLKKFDGVIGAATLRCDGRVPKWSSRYDRRSSNAWKRSKKASYFGLGRLIPPFYVHLRRCHSGHVSNDQFIGLVTTDTDTTNPIISTIDDISSL
jgi:hypothetical protein